MILPIRGLRLGLVLVFGALLGACSPFTYLNAMATDEHYAFQSDIAYGGLPRHRLDLYRPLGQASHPAPVVVFFYGGGWKGGARADYRFVAAALASRGVLVVVPDYRVYPEVVFPAFVEDGAMAVKWVQSEVARFGGDERRIYLMGHSAGAHIAAMLALNRRYLDSTDGDGGRLAGFIGLAGPYDFLPVTSTTMKKIFGNPAPRSTQPIDFVTADAPPTLLVTGDADRTVLPENSRRLAERIRAMGGRASEVSYEGVGHARIVGAFSPPLSKGVPVVEDVLRFIERS
jgi:acetyl esterase/lipase